MAISTIYPNGVNEVIVPATQSIAISNFGGGIASIYYLIVNANRPAAYQLQQTLNNSSVVLGAFADGMTIKIEAGQSVVRYDVGASPDTGIGDADTLNGLASDTAATADTIAARDGSGDITANAFESTVATGTAPLTVASTTVVSNLNADLLDGQEGSYYATDSLVAHLAGIDWTTRTSSVDNSWYAVAYGNGLFVAVSASGTGDRVMTSPDGINWTIRTSAADNQWVAITYGNGLFVAVANSGTGNRVMTSPDGITWTIRTSAADNTWYSVTYGNGLFVAVAITGTGDRVMTSPDGITWTIRTSAADNDWRSVAYGNGLFVAVAYTGTGDRVMTSPDGITWTIRTSAEDNSWIAVTYGNGLFVAVAITGTGNRVMTSPDGITWTIRTSAADNDWRSVAYGNGLFVAIASSGTGNRAMTSPDGITWTIRTSAADNFWRDITYGNGSFVAVSATGTGDRAMTSGKEEKHLEAGPDHSHTHLAIDTAATADTIAARDSSGDITANAYESTVATGTAPLTVASTTVVTNLNADLLDGVQNSAMAHLAGAETFTGSKLFTSALNAQTGSADGSTQAVALLLGARIGTDRSWRFMMGSSSDTEFSGYSMRIYPYDVNSNGDLVLGLGSGDLRVGAGQAATANATTGFTEYFRVANGGVANFLSAPTVGGSNTVYHTGDFDFEEGTFTPVLAGLTTTGVGTYTTQYGRYQKIGNWVHFRIGLTWTAHTGTGNMIITGLPYTSSASIENSTCAVESSNLTYTGDYVIAAVNYAGDQVTPKVVTTGAGSALIPMDTAATLRISGSYLAA